MKKYIRTKQGHIYKRLYKDGALNRGVGYMVDGVIMPFGEDIIKESDNIEELCDEFIVVNDIEKPIISSLSYSKLKLYADGRITEHETLYGAVWTDKGLQFVARMNSKGELELL